MESFYIPTIKEIDNYVKLHNLVAPAEYISEYWDKKGWKTQKGTYPKTLSAAYNVANSYYLTKLRNNELKKVSKIVTDKEIDAIQTLLRFYNRNHGTHYKII